MAAFVQRAAPNGATTASVTSLVSTAIATTTGNLLVGRVFYQSPFNVSLVASVTDTAGNTWRKAILASIDGANNRTDIWYAYNITGNAANVVTASVPAGTTYGSIAVDEFSGMGTNDPLIGFVKSVTGSGTAISSGTLTIPSGATAVIYAAMIANSAGLVAGSGYTLNDDNVIGDATKYFGDEYHIVTASEAATATCTSAAWGICAVAFQANLTPTRFYFPSTFGNAPVFPAFGSGWANTVNLVTTDAGLADITKTGTALFVKPAFGLTPSDVILNRVYVSRPLAAGQVLTGVVHGQTKCDLTNTDAANQANLALTIRIVKNDGTDYAPVRHLIGPTPAASVATTTPPCIVAGTETNRSYRDSTDNTRIAYPPSGVTTVAGDRLVFEIGATTGSLSTFYLDCSDNSTDLPENDTTTSNLDGWIELSQTITFDGQIAYPIADVSAGSWTASSGTDLFATIDETVASDTDYDQSGVAPSNDTMEVQLTSLSTPSTGDVTLTVRHRIH